MLHTILLLQLAAAPPSAQQAEELVHASMRDYELGYFEQALREAEQAYRLYPLAQILFNIGQCNRALKHWERAGFFYERYLARLPDAANRRTVERLLAEVQYRAKEEQARVVPAAPQAAPPPAIVVEAPSPAPVQVETAPAAAVDKPVETPHSHATSVVLGSVAVASLVVMVVGIVEVENFQSLLNRMGSPSNYSSYTAWKVDQATAQGGLSSAQAWQWVAGGTGAAALGTGVGAVLTW